MGEPSTNRTRIHEWGGHPRIEHECSNGGLFTNGEPSTNRTRILEWGPFTKGELFTKGRAVHELGSHPRMGSRPRIEHEYSNGGIPYGQWLVPASRPRIKTRILEWGNVHEWGATHE